MKSYALRRADSGLLATRVALVHQGRVARPVLAVDTGALYTVAEPAFLVSLGLELTRPEAMIDVVGIGGRLRLPCFVLERLHCFGQALVHVQVLALSFAMILPSIHGVLGLRELRASRAIVDVAQHAVTTP